MPKGIISRLGGDGKVNGDSNVGTSLNDHSGSKTCSKPAGFGLNLLLIQWLVEPTICLYGYVACRNGLVMASHHLQVKGGATIRVAKNRTWIPPIT